jgi:hypothetical protein
MADERWWSTLNYGNKEQAARMVNLEQQKTTDLINVSSKRRPKGWWMCRGGHFRSEEARTIMWIERKTFYQHESDPICTRKEHAADCFLAHADPNSSRSPPKRSFWELFFGELSEML